MGLPKACLNALGKVPVRKDVLIMFVSSGGLAVWSTGSFPGGPLYNVGWPIA